MVPPCPWSQTTLVLEWLSGYTEPVFVNVEGDQESIPRIDSASLSSLAGKYDKEGCRTGPPGWESISGLLKRFTNTGSA
jgi:hypothetical protein